MILRLTWSVFYFYNPFEQLIFQKAVDRILESLRKHPRQAWLIYYHDPGFFGGAIEGTPDFVLEKEIIVAGRQFSVYQYHYKDSVPSRDSA